MPPGTATLWVFTPELSTTRLRLKTIIERYEGGRTDVLVNNAGFPIRNSLWEKPFHDVSEKGITNVFAVHTLGTFHCCARALPVMMRQRHGGVIINISSTPAVAGYDRGARYTIAKSVILEMMKHIAKMYGAYGIRCNTIASGMITTARNWGETDRDRGTRIGLRNPSGNGWETRGHRWRGADTRERL